MSVSGEILDATIRDILAVELQEEGYRYANLIGLDDSNVITINKQTAIKYERICLYNTQLNLKHHGNEWPIIFKALVNLGRDDVIKRCRKHFKKKQGNEGPKASLFIWDTKYFFGYNAESVESSECIFCEQPKELRYLVENGSILNIMSFEKYQKKSRDYFKRNFEDQNDRIIEPIVINNNEIMVQLLDKLCSSLNHGSSGSYLVCKYNPSHHHSQFFRCNNHLRELSDRDCFLAYMQKQNVLLFIQIAKALNNPKAELEDSFFNASLVYFMNKDKLEDSNACIMAFVAAPEIKREDFASRKDIVKDRIDTNLFIFFEEISNEKKFLDFIKFRIDFINIHRMELKEDNDSDIFEVVCSRVVTYLAAVKDYMPCFLPGDDRNSHIESRFLLLYKKQRETLESPKNHIIITGHYGSGKTLMAILKLERKLEESDDNSIIYYISHDSLSIIDSYMKNFKSPKISSKGINILHLKKRLSDSLKELRTQHSHHKLHIIVDEYNGEELTEEEAREIKSLLDNEFKESFLVLIPQTMKATRKKNNIEYKTHMFKETGMDVYELPYTMRTTVSINELINVAEEVASREEKKLFLGKDLDRPFSEYTEERAVHKNNRLQSQSNNTNNERDNRSDSDEESRNSLVCCMSVFPSKICNQNEKSEDERGLLDNRSDSDEETSIKPGLSNESEYKSESCEDKTIFYEPDLDEALKIVKKPWFNVFIRSNFRMKFTYGDKSDLGHSIDHDKPVLKRFIPSNNPKTNAYALFTLCEKIRNEEGKKVILCMDENDCEYIAKVISFFNDNKNAYVKYTSQGNGSKCVTVTDKDKAVEHFLNEKLLITNVRAFRGMECENLMVVLDSNKSALYQNVVQAIARCTKNLTIIMFTKTIDNRTLSAIVKQWEQKQVVKTELFDVEVCVNSNNIFSEIWKNDESFSYSNSGYSGVAYKQAKLIINRYIEDRSGREYKEYLETPSGNQHITPLHEAVIKNNLTKIEKLVQVGAKINAKAGSFGYTPLHLARSSKCVDLLLKLGADYKLTDDLGRTPLKLAEIDHKRKVMQMLKTHEIIDALKNDRDQDLRDLLDSTITSEVTQKCFDLCLELASKKNNPIFVGYVMYKFPTNVLTIIHESLLANRHNVTAMLLLCWAATENNYRLLEILLENRPQSSNMDLNLSDKIKLALTDNSIRSVITNREIQPEFAVSLALQKKNFEAAFLLLKVFFSDEAKKKLKWRGLVIKEIQSNWLVYFVDFEEIDLSVNKLSLLKRELFELPHLVSLNISENGLKELPKIDKWGPNLRYLDLSKNKLSNLENCFNGASLRVLNMAGNFLKVVPSSICKINNLETLDLRDNVEISSLPGFLNNNNSLREVLVNSKVRFNVKLENIVRRC